MSKQAELTTFDQVLAVNNDKLVIGNPTVDGATVTASVIGDGKAKKVVVYKYKRKNRLPQEKRTQTAVHGC